VWTPAALARYMSCAGMLAAEAARKAGRPPPIIPPMNLAGQGARVDWRQGEHVDRRQVQPARRLPAQPANPDALSDRAAVDGVPSSPPAKSDLPGAPPD
jgi:hypothetical protein